MRGAGDSRAVQTGKGERRMIRICCITYKDVDRLVREALESYQDNDVEFSIVEGLRTEILEEEKRKVIEGADVAIAAGANAQIAAAAFQIPVLQLRITDFDYLTAVEQGLKLGGGACGGHIPAAHIEEYEGISADHRQRGGKYCL